MVEHPLVKRLRETVGKVHSPWNQAVRVEAVLLEEGYARSPEILIRTRPDGIRVTERLYRNAVEGGHILLTTTAGEPARVELLPARVTVEPVKIHSSRRKRVGGLA